MDTSIVNISEFPAPDPLGGDAAGTAGKDKKDRVTSLPLLDVASPTRESLAATNLLGVGFLRRGQTGLLNGPTGVGKSSLTMQAALCWSVGRAFFGIRPERPLRVLIVQSENDDADIAEMRDGILEALAFDDDERALARRNVRVLRSFAANLAWLAEIEPEVVEHQPDLVIADPLFAFAGVDVAKDQPGLSLFLRGAVLPFTLKHGLGMIFVHHVNKPPSASADRSAYRAGDHAYSGSGHNELANFARFVVVLRSLGSRTVFELRMGKRWARAGIADDEGKPTDKVLIKHAARLIAWESATDADLRETVEQEAKSGASASAAADWAGKIAAAFHAIQKDGAAPLEKLAKRLRVSGKTVRRRFADQNVLRFGDDVFALNNSEIRLVEGLDPAVGN
jgi:hypothetical protein